MPQYLTPGVYVEEIPGAKPIEGVGTATGAFVGVAERGPIGKAVLITNWTQYTQTFGGYIANGYLPYAVNQFFTEGGTKCYVVRTCHYTDITRAGTKTATKSSVTLMDRSATAKDTLKVDALSEGSWGDQVAAIISRPVKDPNTRFDLTILYDGMEVERYTGLALDDAEAQVNGVSQYVTIANQRSSTAAPNNQPAFSTLDLQDRTAATPTLAIVALVKDLNVTVADGTSANTFKLTVTPLTGAVVEFDNLTIANAESLVNGTPATPVWVKNLGSAATPPLNRPAVMTAARALAPPAELTDRAAAPVPTLTIAGLKDGLSFLVEDGTAADSFKLTVTGGSATPAVFDSLTIANAEQTVNVASSPVRIRNLNSASTSPNNRPANTTARVTLPSPVSLPDRVVPAATLRVTALAKALSLAVANGSSPNTFKLTVSQNGSQAENPFDNLQIEDAERKINGVSRYIRVENLRNNSAAPANQPVATASPLMLPFFALTGGWDGLVGITLQDRATQNSPTLAVSAWRDGVTIDIRDSTSDAGRFNIVVKAGGSKVEEFDNLTIGTVEQVVNQGSSYIEVDDLKSATAAPENRPALQTDTVVAAGLWDGDFIGDEGAKNGLHAFDVVDDINIVAMPDRAGDREVIIGAYTYCQNRKDCFFVADPPMGLTPQGAQQFKEGTDIYAGNAFNSSFAALYYPWIYVSDPLTGKSKAVPPSGAVAGTYSYTDVARGVHKAPAGINEGYLNSAVGIERLVTKGEQELLNPIGVNVIRSFPASGIVIWGARTVSADAEFKYINVRRLLLFIEESIDKGSQWVVFEPNDRTLWAGVKRDVTAFLTTVWRSGALFGSTAQEAFFVKVDDENNPPESRDLGRLIIDVGVAPVKPAEFVIFRISQKTQGTKG